MKYFLYLTVFALFACGADGPPKKPSAKKVSVEVDSN
tara:strand:- start:4028 stop:4138 length:111 start_codon:yes stop_codon:yes gene_type:complete